MNNTLRPVRCGRAMRSLALVLTLAALAVPNGDQRTTPHRSAIASAPEPVRRALSLPEGNVPFRLDEAPLGPLSAPENAAVPDDWYAAVTKEIAASEYHIRWQEHAGAYQSPNRKQDLRITYHAGGFSLKPRVADSLWNVSLTLDRIGRTEEWYLPTDSATMTVQEANLLADHGAFVMEYLNTEEGIRQNFIVRERPQGNGPLEVRLDYDSDLHAVDKGGNAIAFCSPVAGTSSYTPTLWYKDLHVWDADGDTLLATASLLGDAIVLTVRDEKANYPITVDPLSTTATWSAESDQANARFGKCVSSAGDVNGDGYSDVIIGAPDFDAGFMDAGRALVYAGSAAGLNAAPLWTGQGTTASAFFGTAVSSAGDLNNDGYSDIVVGSPGFTNGQTNEGRVQTFHGSASGPSSTASRTVESNSVLARMGASLALAGDVNADGFSDVIVGAPDFTNTEATEGRAQIFLGATTGMSATASWSYECNQANARLGWSVAGAGDVNGDGFSDVIVGAILFDNGQTNEGAAFVFHGSTTGLGGTPAWTGQCDQAGAQFGYGVASAGDVNGDGYCDAVVGALYFDNGQTDEGRAFVYHGSATGLGASPAWTGESNQADAYFGAVVACAGDVNGDGFADVVIGADSYSNGQTNEGRAYLYLGNTGGLPATAAWTAEGNQTDAAFGWWVASAGDVNGDGYSDVIIGAPGHTGGQLAEGGASLFLGAAQGPSALANVNLEGPQTGASFGYCAATAGDVNGDGFSDLIIGAPLYDEGEVNEGKAFCFHGLPAGPALAWSAAGDQAGANFGQCVATAGDVNGDGFSDVVVGAPKYDAGQANEGRAFVYHGSAIGLSTASSWTAESDSPIAEFAHAVASAGDVNGDGYSDLIVGAPYHNQYQYQAGRVYAFHGSATGLLATPAWTRYSTQNSARMGFSVACAGDVNGDGYSDVVFGTPGYDGPWPSSGIGLANVYLGAAGGLNNSSWGQTGWTQYTGGAFGYSVAGAGDVNGDGFSDIVIGAVAYSNDQPYEGRAVVYHGSSSGTSIVPAWIAESDQINSGFGVSVSSAGDLNGDGYSDVVVGASDFDNGQTNEGRAYTYLGSPAGLQATAAWIDEGNLVSAAFGRSVSAAGDVNGDGYGDLLVGAPAQNGISNINGGVVAIYHGNNGTGRRHNLRLYNTNLTAPISASNIPVTQFGAGLYANPFLGRGRTRMVWETRYQGQAFSSAGGRITNSTAYTAQQAANTQTALTGTEVKNLVDKLTSTYPFTATKVRARLRYNLVTALTGQVFGPWRYMPGYLDGHGTHNNIPLPVEMLWMEAACDKGTPLLTWATGSEHNNAHFIIERSADAEQWERAGQVSGAGNSQQVNEYAWRDEAPLSTSIVYYRLRQVDQDGREEVLAVMPLEGCSNDPTDLSVGPNPTDGPVEVLWTAGGPTQIVELRLLDAQGRLQRTERVGADAARATLDLSGIAAGSYTLLGLDAHGTLVGSARVMRH